MYLPNTARSVLRARPVRGGPRCRLSSHSTRPWTMLGCCTRQLPTVVAHTHRTPIRHSVIRTARSRLGTCVLQHAGARAFSLPLTRTTLFMVSRKDGLHRRESTSQSTDLTLRGRETRHMSPQSCTSHARGRTHLRPHDCNLELRIVVVAFAWRHVIVVPPGGRGPRSRMEPIERVPRCPPRAPDAATTMRSTSF